MCGHTSFDQDNDMLSSASKLSAAGAAKGKDITNVSLFQGMELHCANKIASYSNCCKVKGLGSGWGHKVGAKCSGDEKRLSELRGKNLCVYVGKTKSSTLGVKTVDKHWFCCWNNILDKIVQVQGRAQLGMNFGVGGSPNCKGLTLAELMKIDFNQIDFSEFYPELIKKIKMHQIEDIAGRVKQNMPKNTKQGKNSGISDNIQHNTNDEPWGKNNY